jgi:hypothetical protein
MAQQERLGMSQVAATRAGQFSPDRTVYEAELAKRIEAHRALTGKNPTGKDLANIQAEAANEMSQQRRVSPFADLKAQTAIEAQIQKEYAGDEILDRLSLQLTMSKEANRPAIEEQIRARKQAIAESVQSRITSGVGGGGAGKGADSGGVKLQPGQLVVDAKGNKAKYIGGDPKDPKSYEMVK